MDLLKNCQKARYTKSCKWAAKVKHAQFVNLCKKFFIITAQNAIQIIYT